MNILLSLSCQNVTTLADVFFVFECTRLSPLYLSACTATRFT